MSHYIVTGGAGFIGSNLVQSLEEGGHSVLVLDNLSTGSVDNLADCPPLALRKSRAGSIPEWDSPPDGIFHLGIPSSPYLYREDRKYCAIAIQDWIDILEYAKKWSTKVVFASTSSLYNGVPKPFYEDRIIEVKDFYTEVRLHMERLGKLYYDFYGVKNIALRLFGVFGEHEEAKKEFANVVTQMMWAKREDKPFEIWGKGNQTRDLVYVKDVVRAFRIAMDSLLEYGIYNVGNGVEWSFNKMAKTVGCKVEFISNPMQNYVERTKAHTSLARDKLGFSPIYRVEEQILRLSRGQEG
ncbi:hypothetical protein LCGC14_1020430 [marine sediment metagenome]|uniref:NAD-dependent epimerase/dehydratase domain-containing protein n=1 Tax=marine sediment metagenome TaxID=412755 RepID=A0A0F9R3H7_9ZZZZ